MRRIYLLAGSLLLLSSACTCIAQAPPELSSTAPGGCWTQASDGNLYASGYKFNLATLAATSFPLPNCNFFQGTDSNFYSWGSSSIYKIKLAGVQTTFATLTSAQGAGIAGLIQGNDGNFYGVAGSGGAYDDGSLFSVSPTGTVTTLYSFTGGADSKTPASLLQASDGKLYGTTNSTVFSSTLAGALTTIANVSGPAPLVEGASGLLYGQFSGGDFDSVSLSGTVAFVASAASIGVEIGGIGCPGIIDGGGDFVCSGTTQDGSGNADETLITIDPDGSGNFGYQFPTPGTNGYSTATYSLAGSGNFYGYYSAISTCGEGCPDNVSYLYGGYPTAAPITAYFTPQAIAPSQSSMLTWQVNNAFSDTMAQCFASGGWSGIKATSGTASVTAPSVPGIYPYALTCGGVETGIATLQVGIPTVALNVSPSTFATGSTVTLTAHVSGTTSGTPTGKVTFMDGSLVIGSATLNGSGVASLTLPTKGVAAGNYNVTASYSGSTVYAAALSNAVAVRVLASKYASITGVTLSAPTVQSGNPITLTATVSGSGEPAPTGSVSFYSGSTLLSKIALSSDPVSVTLPTTGVPAGTYPVTATYSGDDVWTSSTSKSQTITVTAQ